MYDDDLSDQIEPKWTIAVIEYLTDVDNNVSLFLVYLCSLVWTMSITPQGTGFFGVLIISIIMMLPLLILLSPLIIAGFVGAILVEFTLRLIWAVMGYLYRAITGKPKALKPYIPRKTADYSYYSVTKFDTPTAPSIQTPPECKCTTPLWVKVGVVALGIGFLSGE